MITPYVVNETVRCKDRRSRGLLPKDVRKVVVHRCNIEETAYDTCQRFQHDPEIAKYTGGENPYHFFIETERIVQAVKLSERTAHARRFNAEAISIAVIADPTKAPLPHMQSKNLIQICKLMCFWLGGVQGVLYGHDELPGASKDPDKECPGRFIRMDYLRDIVSRYIEGWMYMDGAQRADIVGESGVVF